MPFTQDNIKELAKITRELTNDDIIVSAVPKTITNSGSPHDVVDFMVTHRTTMKYRRAMYRDNLSGFKEAVKKQIDILVDDIHREIVEEAANKPTNTL